MAAATVLVIEDEPDVREMLAVALELEGYNVVVAQDRNVALQQIAKDPPAVILMDYCMPGLEPRTFVMTVNAPVVLMTAARDAVQRARELSLKYVLAKPFDVHALFAVVRSCVQEKFA